MGLFDKIFNNEYIKPRASEPPIGNYNYYQWDKPDFVLPDEFKLDENSSLEDALKVFWTAGGLDFFNVCDSKYYSWDWMDFVGDLYTSIDEGEYSAKGTGYKIPLPDKTKKELLERGVPAVFLTDL
ncbi:MAG: hypothetical protein IJ306_00410 [Oscillospiraceae bacterium]|nr:hypothetical protein [Oscillospiraceae bacterium]